MISAASTKWGKEMVNIARTLFGLDKKPEPVEQKPEPVEQKPDPRLQKTSKFVRPVRLPDNSEEE